MALESRPHSHKCDYWKSCDADPVSRLMVVIGKQVTGVNLLFRFSFAAIERNGAMKLLEDKIRSEGKVLDGGVLKVDGFLNHRLDAALITELGKDIAEHFATSGATLILTVESSGISIAFAAAQAMHLPVLVAKKHKSRNISDGVYSATVFSFTHQTENTVLVSSEYLAATDKVLIVDDFLANGNAAKGLISLVEQAGGAVVGFVAAIEKAEQGGRAVIEAKNVPVYSLARIKEMRAGEIIFD